MRFGAAPCRGVGHKPRHDGDVGELAKTLLNYRKQIVSIVCSVEAFGRRNFAGIFQRLDRDASKRIEQEKALRLSFEIEISADRSREDAVGYAALDKVTVQRKGMLRSPARDIGTKSGPTRMIFRYPLTAR